MTDKLTDISGETFSNHFLHRSIRYTMHREALRKRIGRAEGGGEGGGEKREARVLKIRNYSLPILKVMNNGSSLAKNAANKYQSSILLYL